MIGGVLGGSLVAASTVQVQCTKEMLYFNEELIEQPNVFFFLDDLLLNDVET